MSAKVFSFIFFHWCIKIHRLVVQPGLNVVSCSFFTFLWCSSGNPHQLWLWLENRKTHNTAVFLQRCHCKWVDNVGEGINDLFHIACEMLTVAAMCTSMQNGLCWSEAKVEVFSFLVSCEAPTTVGVHISTETDNSTNTLRRSADCLFYCHVNRNTTTRNQ